MTRHLMVSHLLPRTPPVPLKLEGEYELRSGQRGKITNQEFCGRDVTVKDNC